MDRENIENKLKEITNLIKEGNSLKAKEKCKQLLNNNIYIHKNEVYFTYANILMNMDNISTSLIYYEKALKETKFEKIKEIIDSFRSLALARFHDTTALEILNNIKEKIKKTYFQYENLYEYSLANCHYYLSMYYLNKKINKEELMKDAKINEFPWHLLLIDTAYLLQNNYDREIINEIYSIFYIYQTNIRLDTGYDLIYKLYNNHKNWFYDTDGNKIIEKWLEKYAKNYIKGIKEVERKIEERYPEKPLLKPCDMSKCNGYCCYDGVYLQDGEKEKFIEFIKENQSDFSLNIDDYFMYGNWNNLAVGEKTNIKEFSYSNNFPKHFNQTKCIFSDNNSLCELQKTAVKLGLHPWKYKPLSCLLFPLTISEDNQLQPPSGSKRKDPYNLGPEYPGYSSCLYCGKECMDGISWRKLFKQEILYWEEIQKNKGE